MESSEKNKIDQEVKKTIKVLIADDDPPTRLLLRAAIAKWGYEAIVASDGEEAWQQLQQPNPPQILIVDWLMPKLDGLQLCTRIRGELTFHPYIVLLTQVSGTENIIKGLDAGADEFLSKPFNMAELRSRLSVGAKIIKYENLLSEKNGHLKELAELTEKFSLRFNELIKNGGKDMDVAELQTLQAELINISTKIKNF